MTQPSAKRAKDDEGLPQLIAEAVWLAGGELCTMGHAWQSVGGRACPRGHTENVSQTVYQCARCGCYDYGENGGPGHRECFEEGPCDSLRCVP